MKNDITKEIMNEIERDKVLAFKEDVVMYNAVKKYILYHLYQGVAEPGKTFVGGLNYALQLAWDRQGGVANSAGGIVAFTPKSNEELGADLRALARGINIVESGFKEISDLQRPIVPEKEVENPAV